MNIGIFSISDKYSGFHRVPFLRALSKNIRNHDGRVFYFKRPKWILNIDLNYNKINHTDDILEFPLFTLLPISNVINCKFLYYFFVVVPIKIQILFYGWKYKFKLDVGWIYKPDQYLLLKHFKLIKCYTHYDNYDDDISYGYSLNDNYKLTLIKTLNYSDFIFSTSHRLVEKLQVLTENKVIYFPNAVSSHWLEYHKGNKLNRIVFVGTIDDSIDSELIEKICIKFSQYNIDLIGVVSSDKIIEIASYIDNLNLLGPINYDDLPKMLSSYKLGICVYKKSKFNYFRNPLKLYEYCAVGIPSVSTECDFDRIGREYVSIVKNNNDFINAIEYELKFDDEIRKKSRLTFIKKNTWDDRAVGVIAYIKGLLNE